MRAAWSIDLLPCLTAGFFLSVTARSRATNPRTESRSDGAEATLFSRKGANLNKSKTCAKPFPISELDTKRIGKQERLQFGLAWLASH
jgi:hypothetical protein